VGGVGESLSWFDFRWNGVPLSNAKAANSFARLAKSRAAEGWTGRRAFARRRCSFTVSTKTDAPREELDMSSGQAPVLSATPGARDGQAARRRSPGTVRVTPSTLTGTSLADGSNAPSPGPSGVLT
jgi:hypothetical protein